MQIKPRNLCLMKMDRTDEEHTLTTNQLIEILKDEFDIYDHRTTISKAIVALVDLG